MQEEIVQFRGKKEGLELILDSHSDYEKLRAELCSILHQRRSFFNAGDIGVKILGKQLTLTEKNDLKQLLMEQFNLAKVTFDGEPEKKLTETVRSAQERKAAVPEKCEKRNALLLYLHNGTLRPKDRGGREYCRDWRCKPRRRTDSGRKYCRHGYAAGFSSCGCIW